eukprot:gi/632966470/ref/XP_007899433.1/ PREDICTED: mucin-2-like [Callorhinchus milii]
MYLCAGTSAPIAKFCHGKAIGIYPDPNDNASFFQCLGDISIYSTCQNNRIFDPIDFCILLTTAAPTQPTTTTEAPVQTTEAPVQTTEAPVQTTVASTTTSQGTTTAIPTFCTGLPDGVHVDPLDVTSFYFCRLGKTIHVKCDPDLVFSDMVKACIVIFVTTPPGTTERVTTTEATTTTQPTTTTKATTTQPTTTTKATTTTQPTTTTEATTTQPTTTTEATTTQPTTTTEATTTTQPTTTTEATTTTQPTTTTEATTTTQPTTTTKATTTTTEATTTTTEATTTMTEATTTTDPTTTTTTTTVEDSTLVTTTGPQQVDPNFCILKPDGLYIDPTDSSSFYQCAFGRTFHLSCPPGLIFNPQSSVCDFPINVQPSSAVPSPSTTGPQQVDPNFCILKPDGLYIDPKDSSSFYQCAFGRTFHLSCPPGLIFNPQSSVCDFPINVQPSTAVPSPSTTGPQQVDPNFCILKPDGLYIDPKDSSSFYQCAFGRTFHLSCPPGLIFNPQSSVCDFPINVQPSSAVPSPSTTGPDQVDPNFCNLKPDGLYIDPKDSSSFYQCAFRRTFHLSCPPGLIFNSQSSVCDFPINVQPSSAMPSPSTTAYVEPNFCCWKPDGFYKDPANKSSFYQCMNSKTIHLTCPPDMEFNPWKNRCDTPCD